VRFGERVRAGSLVSALLLGAGLCRAPDNWTVKAIVGISFN
jgi:hypothetical protein